MHANLDEGEEMVSPTVIASQFADWTDPRKVFGAIRPGKESLVNQDVHTDLALDIFTKLGASGNSQSLPPSVAFILLSYSFCNKVSSSLSALIHVLSMDFADNLMKLASLFLLMAI